MVSYRINIGIICMDLVADTFGPVKKEANRKIKRALDPNGIFAPGNGYYRLSEKRWHSG